MPQSFTLWRLYPRSALICSRARPVRKHDAPHTNGTRPPFASPALMPTMFCSAIPTLTRRSGKRLRNAFRLEDPIESFATATIRESFSARAQRASEKAARQSNLLLIQGPVDFSDCLFEFRIGGNTMMPFHFVFDERHAAAFVGVRDDAVRAARREGNGSQS